MTKKRYPSGLTNYIPGNPARATAREKRASRASRKVVDKCGYGGTGRRLVQVEVIDPYEPSKRRVVEANTRTDPVKDLVTRGLLTWGQGEAAARYSYLMETAEIGGARAIDYERERVDGGRIPEPLDERTMEAQKELSIVNRKLSTVERLIIIAVCKGVTVTEFASHSGYRRDKTMSPFMRLLRDGLSLLAEEWGYERKDFRGIRSDNAGTERAGC